MHSSKLNININKKKPIEYIEDQLKNGGVIDELIITAYSVGIKPFLYLDKNKSRIKKVKIYHSGYLRRMRKDVFTKLLLMCDKNKWELVEINSHMKIILINGNNEYLFVNSTSNFSSNSKIESTRIVNNENVCLSIKNLLECLEVRER